MNGWVLLAAAIAGLTFLCAAAAAPAEKPAARGVVGEPRIVDVPATPVVGVAYNPEEQGWDLVPTLWFALCRKLPAIKNVVRPGVSYGYIHARKGEKPDTYLACVAVSKVEDLPEGVIASTLPAGKYAVFTVRGGLGDIAGAYQHMNQVWQPRSQYDWAWGGAIERYDERFVPDGTCTFEIWQAVKPKK